MVERYLKSGRLRLVPGAAEFAYPAYAVYSESADAKIVTPALVGLRHVAGSGSDKPARPTLRQRGTSR
ncbi:hypothetical protein D3C83_278660 [compost metagenome]